jgi:hypothetical protein
MTPLAVLALVAVSVHVFTGIVLHERGKRQ